MINGIWTPIYDNDLPKNSRPYITKYIEVPCGQCLGCRLQRSREWANRMMMELKTTPGEVASFITLTYDDEHLHLVEGVNHITGEVQEFGTLVLEDLQLFIKRLRKRLEPQKIRYFACGEYGEKTQRPHYHLIVFGWFPEDAVFRARGRKGEYNYYSSKILDNLWPNGLNVVADVTWESCAYTARYVVKKFTGDMSYLYDEKNIKPPFVSMSKKPGLGFDYFMKYHAMFNNDEIKKYYLSTDSGSISFSKPRYFKKIDDLASFIPLTAETYSAITKEHDSDTLRIMYEQEQERKIIELQTDLDYFEALAAQGEYKKRQTEVLKRGIV